MCRAPWAVCRLASLLLFFSCFVTIPFNLRQCLSVSSYSTLPFQVDLRIHRFLSREKICRVCIVRTYSPVLLPLAQLTANLLLTSRFSPCVFPCIFSLTSSFTKKIVLCSFRAGRRWFFHCSLPQHLVVLPPRAGSQLLAKKTAQILFGQVVGETVVHRKKMFTRELWVRLSHKHLLERDPQASSHQRRHGGAHSKKSRLQFRWLQF